MHKSGMCILSLYKEGVGYGKLPHISIPSKIAALVSEFAAEYLPLGRTAALAPDFAVKYLPLGRIL